MLNLLATILLCMGLANVSPFNHANEETARTIHPKKSNVTTTYDLEINTTNMTSLNRTIYVDWNIQQDCEEYAYKYNLQGNNNALNVIGNTYFQTYRAIINGESTRLFGNAYLDENSLTYYQSQNEITKIGYMLQVTPYNINIETEITFNIQMDMTTIGDPYWWDNTEMKTDIYSGTDNGWTQYIGMQNAYKIPSTIQEEIEDVNNGFYYSKVTEYDNLESPINTSGNFQKEITINITPNVTNFYYFLFTPLIYNDDQQTGTPVTNPIVPSKVTYGVQRTIHITGTNIVPDGEYEVVNIPGLMFDVLTMPFAFVSQAFNLTLFPGTPYQINIANLFLSIIAILVFVWLMKKFTKL